MRESFSWVFHTPPMIVIANIEDEYKETTTYTPGKKRTDAYEIRTRASNAQQLSKLSR